MKYRKVQFKSSDKKILAIHPYDGYLLELIDYDYLTNSWTSLMYLEEIHQWISVRTFMSFQPY